MSQYNEIQNALLDLKGYQKEIDRLGGRELCEAVADKKQVYKCKENLGYASNELMTAMQLQCNAILQIEEATRKFIAKKLGFHFAVQNNLEAQKDSETMTEDELFEKHYSVTEKLALQFSDLIVIQLKDKKQVNKLSKYNGSMMSFFGEELTRPSKENKQKDMAEQAQEASQMKVEIRKMRSKDFFVVCNRLANWRISKGYNRNFVANKLGTSIDIIKKIEEGNEHTESGIFLSYIKLANIELNFAD